MDKHEEALAALDAYDDFNIEIIGDDGFPIIGSVERSAWVIKKLRAVIETPATSETPEQIVARVLEERIQGLDADEKLHYPDETVARIGWFDELEDVYDIMVEAARAGMEARS